MNRSITLSSLNYFRALYIVHAKKIADNTVGELLSSFPIFLN